MLEGQYENDVKRVERWQGTQVGRDGIRLTNKQEIMIGCVELVMVDGKRRGKKYRLTMEGLWIVEPSKGIMIVLQDVVEQQEFDMVWLGDVLKEE